MSYVKHHTTKNRMANSIMDLYKEKKFTIEEIAALIGTSPYYVKKTIKRREN